MISKKKKSQGTSQYAYTYSRQHFLFIPVWTFQILELMNACRTSLHRSFGHIDNTALYNVGDYTLPEIHSNCRVPRYLKIQMTFYFFGNVSLQKLR
jgi:hypothetical protein